ncbi:MAG TPA: hypothetical protein VF559_09355 [Caulobacteraceae bacterium]
MAKPVPKIACRQIVEADLAAAAALLREGFPDRTPEYWGAALEVLRLRQVPGGYPRYGYLLEVDGEAVGLILLIFSAVDDQAGDQIRCNVSSWYVRPAFRNYGVLLTSAALSFKEAVYLNISPARPTWPILDAQGYRRYSNGQMACVPALGPPRLSARIRRHDPASEPEFDNLIEPAAKASCLVLIVESDGERLPFVFVRREIRHFGKGVAQLAYCPSTADFVRFAGPLGRYLLRRGLPVVLLDSEARVPGLVGKFFKDRMPKYFRGPRRPRLNDLRHTEAVLFGV